MVIFQTITGNIKKISFGVVIILLVIIASSCKKEDMERIKIGMFVYGDGYRDAGWRENCRRGVLLALDEYPFDTLFLSTTTEIQEVMDEFPEKGVDLLILGGMIAEAEMLETARKNPGMQFVIIDDRYEGDLDNVRSIHFAAEEAAFPLGFLAAAWAGLKDTLNPVVGIVAGMDVPPVRRIFEAYQMGIAYFNNQYRKSILSQLTILNSFDNDDQGYRAGDSLIRLHNADVIAVLAGNAGNGSLRAARDLGKWGIGIDVDQFYSLPEVSDILLSSCIKQLDSSIYTVTVQYLTHQVNVEKVHVGTLANRGVALAPYHAFETQIPDSIKDAVEEIKKRIVHGTIIP